MIELYATKGPNGVLIPMNEFEAEKLSGYKMGQPIKIRVVTVKQRVYNFLKKFFSMIWFAYDNWEPKVIEDERLKKYNMEPEKNKEQFREDIIILAGFSQAFYRLDNTFIIKAKSVSYDKMKDDEFTNLYKSAYNVIHRKILTTYSVEEFNRVLKQLEEYG